MRKDEVIQSSTMVAYFLVARDRAVPLEVVFLLLEAAGAFLVLAAGVFLVLEVVAFLVVAVEAFLLAAARSGPYMKAKARSATSCSASTGTGLAYRLPSWEQPS